MLVEELANAIQARLIGAGKTEINGVASLESAGPAELVFVEDTARLQQALGGREDTTDIARLFFAPGVAHCAGGPGAQPDNPLNQLVDWVENGKAPSSLNGVVRDPSTGAVTATRPICMYPNVAVYEGHGPTTEASSFACRPSSSAPRRGKSI